MLRSGNKPTKERHATMQKFILIRGHQGSGKSTFAEQKAVEFAQQYPDAEIVHIENDLLMTDENGVQ